MKFKVRKGHIEGRKLLWVETHLDKRVGKSRTVSRQMTGKKKQGIRKGNPGESCSVTLGQKLTTL